MNQSISCILFDTEAIKWGKSLGAGVFLFCFADHIFSVNIKPPFRFTQSISFATTHDLGGFKYIRLETPMSFKLAPLAKQYCGGINPFTAGKALF